MLNSNRVDENFAGASRRDMLRSALLTAVCAGLPAAASAAARGGSAARSSTALAAGRPSSGPGTLSKGMVGFMLAHEQFPAPELVRLGASAETAGFDLVATSDHFQPWQSNEGHAGLAWVTLGALGQRTQRLWMGPTVTCPTLRYSPAVVAEAYATLSLLCPRQDLSGTRVGRSAERTGRDRGMAEVERALGPAHRGGRDHPSTLDGKAAETQGRPLHRRWAALRSADSTDPIAVGRQRPQGDEARGRTRGRTDHGSENLEATQVGMGKGSPLGGKGSKLDARAGRSLRGRRRSGRGTDGGQAVELHSQRPSRDTRTFPIRHRSSAVRKRNCRCRKSSETGP